jgi:hypothetical protein
MKKIKKFKYVFWMKMKSLRKESVLIFIIPPGLCVTFSPVRASDSDLYHKYWMVPCFGWNNKRNRIFFFNSKYKNCFILEGLLAIWSPPSHYQVWFSAKLLLSDFTSHPIPQTYPYEYQVRKVNCHCTG